jgi:hypothetical protein
MEVFVRMSRAGGSWGRWQWLVWLGLGLNMSCGVIEPGTELSFDYVESAHGTVVTPSVDASSLSSREVVFVGQLNTPKPCYKLEGDVSVDGTQITLTVDARETSSATCEAIVGRFIYQGSIRRVGAGTYQLKFRHKFDKSDWPTQEFTIPVTVR